MKTSKSRTRAASPWGRVPRRGGAAVAAVRSSTVTLALTLSSVLWACGEGDAVRTLGESRVFRPLRPVRLEPVDSATRLGFTRTDEDGGLRGGAESLFEWETPEGWRQLGASGMRLLNFRVAGRDDAECYLTMLQGSGGGVLANVNRWRRQMGRSPLSQAEVDRLPRREFFGRDAVLVEVEGTLQGKKDRKLLALLVVLPMGVITMKMTGPAEVVDDERGRFLELCDSLRLRHGPASAAGKSEAGSGPRTASAFDPGKLRWRAPEGWKRKPVESAMRVVTFAASPSGRTECVVFVLRGDGGGVVANLNRWRGQVGQPPLSPEAIGDLPRIQVLGRRVPLLDARGDFDDGMGGPRRGDQGLLGVVRLLDEHALFVKMVGPAEEVAAQKDAFVAFCRSLEFEG